MTTTKPQLFIVEPLTNLSAFRESRFCCWATEPTAEEEEVAECWEVKEEED